MKPRLIILLALVVILSVSVAQAGSRRPGAKAPIGPPPGGVYHTHPKHDIYAHLDRETRHLEHLLKEGNSSISGNSSSSISNSTVATVPGSRPATTNSTPAPPHHLIGDPPTPSSQADFTIYSTTPGASRRPGYRSLVSRSSYSPPRHLIGDPDPPDYSWLLPPGESLVFTYTIAPGVLYINGVAVAGTAYYYMPGSTTSTLVYPMVVWQPLNQWAMLGVPAGLESFIPPAWWRTNGPAMGGATYVYDSSWKSHTNLSFPPGVGIGTPTAQILPVVNNGAYFTTLLGSLYYDSAAHLFSTYAVVLPLVAISPSQQAVLSLNPNPSNATYTRAYNSTVLAQVPSDAPLTQAQAEAWSKYIAAEINLSTIPSPPNWSQIVQSVNSDLGPLGIPGALWGGDLVTDDQRQNAINDLASGLSSYCTPLSGQLALAQLATAADAMTNLGLTAPWKPTLYTGVLPPLP